MDCKQQLDYLRQAIELISGNFYLKDTHGRYLQCNEQQLSVARVDKREAILGKTDRDLYPPAIAEEIIQIDKEIMASQEQRILEERAKGADGKEIIFLVKKNPFYNEKGEVIGIIGVGTDITALKRAEDKVYELDNIIAQLPGNVYWYSKEFTYLGCNENSAKTLGMTRAETIGKDFRKLIVRIKNIDKKTVNTLINDGIQVVKTDKPKLNIEEPPFTGPHGEPLYWVANKVPLRNRQGETYGVVGISTDITKQKKLEVELRLAKEKAEVANQAKSEFLENMRHDLRTPLSGIVGCAQLIQLQADNPEKIIEYADNLVQSSDALLEFFNKILETIQVSSGQIPLLKKKFDLQQCLEQVVRLNKPQAIIKQIGLHLDYDKAIPTYLLGDPIRLQHIILELLSNALKFTDKGKVKITAQLMQSKTRSRQIIIKLSVSDTGMGIPFDKQNEVYMRFKRLTPAYQGIPGTGLGLSVVKQFIDDLGGEIHLSSKLSKGSTFTCLIPFQESLLVEGEYGLRESQRLETNNNSSQQLSVKSSFSRNREKLRILIVEDDAIAAKVAQGVVALSLGDCQVDIAPDGKTALSYAEKHDYKLILLDVGLPDNDGCEVARCIRLKQGQRNPTLSIVGLTAHISAEKKRSCLANGMDALYMKPLTREKISEILKSILAHQATLVPAAHSAEASDSYQTLSVLDLRKAAQFWGSEVHVNEGLVLLVKELTEDLKKLQRQHEHNDWRAIREMAHKWRGGAAYCSAMHLEKACEALETYLQTGAYEQAEDLFQQLIRKAETTKEAATQHIASSG